MAGGTGAADRMETLDEFVARHREDFVEGRVDMLGVNLAADGGHGPAFKIYYADKAGGGRTHPMIEFLRQKDMVRSVSMVEDKDDPERLRYDVRLAHETRENMEDVFRWLQENTGIFPLCGDEIRNLAAMKVTDGQTEDLSALNFLGCMSVGDTVTVLKCHYSTGIGSCKYHITDEYYLDYLRDCGIPAFARLSQMTRAALGHCGGYLWGAGADYWLTGEKKYKIYVQLSFFLYQGLIEMFEKEAPLMAEQIGRLMLWSVGHPEFMCMGFGLALDEQNRLSLNFYYHYKRDNGPVH